MTLACRSFWAKLWLHHVHFKRYVSLFMNIDWQWAAKSNSHFPGLPADNGETKQIFFASLADWLVPKFPPPFPPSLPNNKISHSFWVKGICCRCGMSAGCNSVGSARVLKKFLQTFFPLSRPFFRVNACWKQKPELKHKSSRRTLLFPPNGNLLPESF